MKKLYDEYVRVEKDKKMTHKVFFTNIGLAILVICMCLTAMSFTAYAYFTSSITSGNNTIVAANYNVEATVVEDSNKAAVVSVDGSYQLNSGKTYEVTLTGEGTASVGYCKVIIKYGQNELTFYSEPIATPTGSQNQISKKQIFTISVPTEITDATVEFVAEWGSYSGENVISNTISLETTSTSTTNLDEDTSTQTAPTQNPSNDAVTNDKANTNENNTAGTGADTKSDEASSSEGTDGTDGSQDTDNSGTTPGNDTSSEGSEQTTEGGEQTGQSEDTAE